MKRGNKINTNLTNSTNSIIPKTLKDVHTFESVIQSRMNYSGVLGESYGGNRDLYQALGYDKKLTYQNYYNMFKREDIGKTLIEKLPKTCWTNPPIVTDEQPNSVFENAFEEFAKKYSLYSLLFRADKLMGLGVYGVLFLGFNDVKSSDLSTEVLPGTNLELLYMQPYSSEAAKIHSVELDPGNERFGLPKLYQISVQNSYNALQGTTVINTTPILVHYSRIIHLVEDPLENLIEGTPRLEAIYNRVQDTRKVLGGSAEMFWRNGVPGKVAKAEKDYTLGQTDKENLQEQFDEYENNLRRWLTVQGVEISNLETAIQDPKSFLDCQMNIISIVTGIPKRILMGSERGELASDQDQDAWNDLISNRQEEQCGPCFLRPLIDKLIEYGILDTPHNDTYMINWPILISIGEKDKSEIALNRAKTVKEYITSGSEMVIPVDIFLKNELGFDQAQIAEINRLSPDMPYLSQDNPEGENLIEDPEPKEEPTMTRGTKK